MDVSPTTSRLLHTAAEPHYKKYFKALPPSFHTLIIIVLVLLAVHMLPGLSLAATNVRIGYEQNHPVVGTAQNGRAQGILIDVVEEVARREGWTIQYAPCIWNKCLENLEKGDIDLLVAIAYTPERAEKFSYNQHTVISNWGVLYAGSDTKIESYADLNGKRVAVVKEDVYCNTFIKMLQEFDINCDVVFADNFKNIFAMINSGEVDAGVANRFFSLLNEKSFKVKATPIIFSPVSVQVAAPKGKSAVLIAAFDRQLEDMKKDNTSVYHQSLERWLGVEVGGASLPLWLRWLVGVVSGGAALLLVFVSLLRREVTRKTTALRKLTTAVEQSANSVMITDTSGVIEYVNPRFCAVSGYSLHEAIGKRPSLLKSGLQPPEFYAELWRTIKSGQEWSGEFQNKRKDGSLYWDLCSIAPVRNRSGKITNFVAIKEDITARKKQEEVLIWQASHDIMTGLSNRYYLESYLSSEIMRIDTQRQYISLLLIDIDKLKFVNDTYGHDFGDSLLIEISKRLQLAACPDCLVARFLGDEFVLVPPVSDTPDRAANLADTVKEQLRELFTIDGAEVVISASIGVVTYPNDGDSADALLRNAEAAMYEAKRLGRNNVVCYTNEFHKRTQRRLMLEARLHHALANNEFTLHYQPQICLERGVIVGVEALLRWDSPGLPPVIADEFIPILEGSSMIVPVGAWVLRESCRQCVAWQQAGLPAMRLSVNISVVQFQRGNLEETVRLALVETGFDPALLCLELTESMLMIDTSSAQEKLQELASLGVSFSLDDFGTGYSSLAYLSRLPVQELKVDQSFIHRLHKTPSDTAVVNTIIAMAQELNLDLVAEGVETEEQKTYLQGRGCSIFQGFLFSKALSPEDLEKFVWGWKKNP